jgi:hypothetical protein
LNLEMEFLSNRSCIILPDASVLLGVRGANTNDAMVVKLKPNGALDRDFQDEGVLIIKNDGKLTLARGLTQTDHESFYVFGAALMDEDQAGLVMKYDNAGRKVEAFGQSGSSELTADGHFPFVSDVQASGDDRLLITGNAEAIIDRPFPGIESMIAILSIDGKPDKNFNEGRPVFSQFTTDTDADTWRSAALQRDGQGKVLTIGSGGADRDTGPVVGRFMRDGAPDVTFVGNSAFGTLPGAQFFSARGPTFIHPTPGLILVVGSEGSRPAVFALKV